VPVFLNGMHNDEVSVELYANEMNGMTSVKQKMQMLKNDCGESNAVYYSATVPADRPANYYTPRVMPLSEIISIPLEFNNILWEH